VTHRHDPDLLLALLRPAVGSRVRAVERAVMYPANGATLPEDLRALLALRVAQVTATPEEQRPWAVTAERLATTPHPVETVADPALWAGLPARTVHALAYVEQIALDPADVGPSEVADLRATGFSNEDVVRLSQVAAFTSFRIRLLTGLALLVESKGAVARRSAAVERAVTNLPPPDDRFPSLDWVPSVTPAPRPATPAGTNDATHHIWSPFYLTLLHDPVVLAERTALYNEIMTGAGALPRADRELAALATSLVTGCHYCASVHGQRQVRLARDPQPALMLATYGVDGSGVLQSGVRKVRRCLDGHDVRDVRRPPRDSSI
jgi:AhpD family alkylhydroperoxidase